MKQKALRQPDGATEVSVPFRRNNGRLSESAFKMNEEKKHHVGRCSTQVNLAELNQGFTQDFTSLFNPFAVCFRTVVPNHQTMTPSSRALSMCPLGE